MCIILADGVPHIELKGDTVSVTITSGGDVYGVAFRVADATAAAADFLGQLERREGREANLVAFPRAHAERA